jgi:hypothetical protein
MKRQLFLAGILTLTLFACENLLGEKELKLVTVSPASCGNPWENKSYGANVSPEENFTNYLRENGVKHISNFELISDNEYHCLSCGCPSGITIKFMVTSADYRRLKKIPSFSAYLR